VEAEGQARFRFGATALGHALARVVPTLARFGPEGALLEELKPALMADLNLERRQVEELLGLVAVDVKKEPDRAAKALVTKEWEGQKRRYRFHPDRARHLQGPQKPPGGPATGGGGQGQGPGRGGPQEDP
jgi:hypothetical protein